MVLETGSRVFAVTDYENPPAEEPQDNDQFDGFLAQLQNIGDRFEREVLARFGRQELRPSSVADFPRAEAGEPPNPALAPAPGSNAAWVEADAPDRPPLVRETGERGAADEYLVITGEGWFYKCVAPTGPACDLHSWPSARTLRVAAPEAHMGGLPTSFTASGQTQHCAHRGIQGIRDGRCLMDRIETHLCCRACVFHAVCWTIPTDLARLPCPPP
jgi:hypothetical protein